MLPVNLYFLKRLHYYAQFISSANFLYLPASSSTFSFLQTGRDNDYDDDDERSSSKDWLFGNSFHPKGKLNDLGNLCNSQDYCTKNYPSRQTFFLHNNRPFPFLFYKISAFTTNINWNWENARIRLKKKENIK